MPIKAMTKSKQGTAESRLDGGAEGKLDIAVQRVVAEVGANPDVRDCTPAEARTMITDWLIPIVERSRHTSGKRAYPTDAEMFVDDYEYSTPTRSYEIFDAVMPHSAESIDGSAHQAIEDVVLDPSKNEYALIHEQTGTPGYCSVATLIGVVDGLTA
ncbi:MAG: hypothetical protein JWN75_625 [Candidatus Saccharibacteria bacterium]|nr:hypothetical protein [Candidatus Saccharibacteria bacterium]